MLADRLDGKAVTPIAGSDDRDPLRLSGRIEATNLQMANASYDIIHRSKLEAEERGESSQVAG
jgi:hypothetical protein